MLTLKGGKGGANAIANADSIVSHAEKQRHEHYRAKVRGTGPLEMWAELRITSHRTKGSRGSSRTLRLSKLQQSCRIVTVLYRPRALCVSLIVGCHVFFFSCRRNLRLRTVFLCQRRRPKLTLCADAFSQKHPNAMGFDWVLPLTLSPLTEPWRSVHCVRISVDPVSVSKQQNPWAQAVRGAIGILLSLLFVSAGGNALGKAVTR